MNSVKTVVTRVVAALVAAALGACAHRSDESADTEKEGPTFQQRLLSPEGSNFADGANSRRSRFENKNFKSKGFTTKEYRTKEATVGKRYKDRQRDFPTAAFQKGGADKKWHDADKVSPLADDKARTKEFAGSDKKARTKAFRDADKDAATKEYAGADRRFKSSTTKRQNYATTKAMENSLGVEDLVIGADKSSNPLRSVEGTTRKAIRPMSLGSDAPALEKPLSIDEVRYLLNKGGR